LLAVGFIEKKSFGAHCLGEFFSANKNRRRACARKHSTKVTTDSTGADDADSRPVSNFAHYPCFGGMTPFRLYVEYAVGAPALAMIASTTRAKASVCQCFRVSHHCCTPS